jgi:hypothetical protein
MDVKMSVDKMAIFKTSVDKMALNEMSVRVTRRLGKIRQNVGKSSQNKKTIAKPPKGQDAFTKASFESPKYTYQTTSKPLKYFFTKSYFASNICTDL